MLRFEVSAETLATFREAMKLLRQKSGETLDDGVHWTLEVRSFRWTAPSWKWRAATRNTSDA